MKQKFFRMHNSWCHDLQCFNNVQCPVNWAWRDYQEALANDDEDDELPEEEDICLCIEDHIDLNCPSCF